VSEWTRAGLPGNLVRHVAFGYTLAINCERESKFSSAGPLKRLR